MNNGVVRVLRWLHRGNFLFLAAFFGAAVVLGAVQKPMFLLVYGDGVSAGEFLAVVVHGLKLDVTVAGYLTAVPVLLAMVNVWLTGAVGIRRAVKLLLKIWVTVAAAAVSLTFTGNLGLYGYWGFPLDGSVLQFLATPREAAASLTAVQLAGYTVAAVGAFAVAMLWLLWSVRLWNDRPEGSVTGGAVCTLALLLTGGLDFLAIRGGVSKAVANVSMVYFSDRAVLNHAAVNPLFSFLASLSSVNNLDEYDVYDESLRAALFDGYLFDQKVAEEERPRHLRSDRPDIVLILAESFGRSTVDETVDGEAVAPEFQRLKSEGVYFDNMIANSSRTDRGTIAVLSGFPAQPKSSVMKMTAKARRLPSIAATLRSAGWSTSFVYGGDINFTNTAAYLYGTGFERLIWQNDMHFDVRPSNWGYADDVTAECLADHLLGEYSHRRDGDRLFTVWQTLSSHEPFDVPFGRFDDPMLNSMAFADSCIGRTVERLRQSPMWDNLLIIIVADHAIRYPADTANESVARHRIPMLWLGGAVSEAATVETYASQTDIAATLLEELHLPHDDFRFSRDIFSRAAHHCGYYCFNDGFGIVDDGGETVCDHVSGGISSTHHDTKPLETGKAVLQTTFKAIKEL